MRRTLLLVLALLVPVSAHAAGSSLWEATSLAVGGQAAFFDRGAADFDRDFEASGKAAISVSPHFSIVGSGSWGLEHHYTRGMAGARITATDVNDADFSIGIGAERQWLSDESAGMDEWVGTATVGYAPWKEWPFQLGAQTVVGMESKSLRYTVAATIPFKIVATTKEDR